MSTTWGSQFASLSPHGNSSEDRLDHNARTSLTRRSNSRMRPASSGPSSRRNDSLAMAMTCPMSTSLSWSIPAELRVSLRRNNPAPSTSRVVVGTTTVEGYPASETKSDWRTTAGRAFSGLVLTRGLNRPGTRALAGYPCRLTRAEKRRPREERDSPPDRPAHTLLANGFLNLGPQPLAFQLLPQHLQGRADDAGFRFLLVAAPVFGIPAASPIR